MAIGISPCPPFNKRIYLTTLPPPAILLDGNTVAWYRSYILATITKDGLNRVSRWNDFLGSGHDLIGVGAVGTYPVWSNIGIVSVKASSQCLQTGAFAYIQPEMIYMVCRQDAWTVASRLFDGIPSAVGAITQFAATPALNAYAGASLNNVNLPLNTWGVIRLLINGVTSTFQIDLTASVNGNLGASNMNGFTFTADGIFSITGYSDLSCKEIILRKIADTAPNQLLIYNYLRSINGI